ncbi:MAG: hypothetical protein EPN22_08700 [Nitrospirae bacterium]|nr:MAG: hypothetical protein EPN22_08700 [Nitrospirota bacterium]
MKILKVVLCMLVALGLALSTAFAAGDAVKGKALYNDAKFGGGTSGKSCNSCHPDGKRLEGAADRNMELGTATVKT